MSLQNLSLLPFVLGLLALGGVLFALQRLRVRHRDLRVPTTLFWTAAVERARARTLVERFRHPLPFLLVLCIAWLLWTSMAGPRRDGDSTVEHLVLIDASAGMAGQDRLALAKEEAARVAASLPRNFTTIRLCGSIPETVLLPGENPLLLERRLGMVEPAACPSTIERELRMLPAAGEHDLQVWVIGGQPIDASLRELLPERIEVVRIACGLESLATNRAITALAATEAASGRYDRCDVFIEARGAGSGALAVTIGADSTLRIEPEIDEGRAVRFGIALASVAPVTCLMPATRAYVEGRALNEINVKELDAAVDEDVTPIDDIRSTGTYRSHCSRGIVRGFLRQLGASV